MLFYLHYCLLLSNYKVFNLNPRNFFMIFPENLSFINPITFQFFPLYIVSLIHLKYQRLLQHLLQCLYKYNLFMYTMKLCVCVSHNFAFSLYFGFTQSYQKLYITILLILLCWVDDQELTGNFDYAFLCFLL